jgi:alanyl-tRNA synthetase
MIKFSRKKVHEETDEVLWDIWMSAYYFPIITVADEIGYFKIISEAGIAAGIRRIEALTGDDALAWSEDTENQLQTAANLLKTNRQNLIAKLEQLFEEKRQIEKECQRLKSQLAGSKSTDLLSQTVDIQGIKVLAVQIEGVDTKTLRELVDQLKDKLQTAVVLLATIEDQKVRLIAGVTKNCTDRLSAGNLVNHVATQLGGKGGGRPDMAQGGGENPSALPGVLKSIPDWVGQQLSQSQKKGHQPPQKEMSATK